MQQMRGTTIVSVRRNGVVAVGGDIHGNVYLGDPTDDPEKALAIYRRVYVSSCRPLPMRGIDVGAKSEISEIINRLAEERYGVIFVSSELKEILAMSDRILVMSKGKITGEFTHQEATEEKLVASSAIGHGPSNGGNHHGSGN